LKEKNQTLIRNCRFAFRCHQQWSGLEQTSDPRIRYCHECSRPVVLCRSDAELRTSLEADECVAIPGANSCDSLHTVGIVMPRGWKD
jgi:hypothetical protein